MTAFGSVTCLTIVAEAILADRLVELIDGCGARGWTISMAQGHGPSEHHVSGIEGGNVRVETLVSSEVAAAIWAGLEERFFEHYAVSAWAYDVRVARLARYT